MVKKCIHFLTRMNIAPAGIHGIKYIEKQLLINNNKTVIISTDFQNITNIFRFI
jgi:hypothetical protein